MGFCSPDNGMATFHIQPLDILSINFQVHTKFLWIKVQAKLWTRGMKFEYVHIAKPQGPPPGQLHQVVSPLWFRDVHVLEFHPACSKFCSIGLMWKVAMPLSGEQKPISISEVRLFLNGKSALALEEIGSDCRINKHSGRSRILTSLI